MYVLCRAPSLKKSKIKNHTPNYDSWDQIRASRRPSTPRWKPDGDVFCSQTSLCINYTNRQNNRLWALNSRNVTTINFP